MGSCLNLFRRDDATGIMGFYIHSEDPVRVRLYSSSLPSDWHMRTPFPHTLCLYVECPHQPYILLGDACECVILSVCVMYSCNLPK